MRREHTFALVGFLLGFVLAAMLFFQNDPPAAPEPQHAIAAAPAREGGAAPGGEAQQQPKRVGRAVAIADDDPAPAAPAEKSGATLLQDALAALPGLDEGARDVAVKDLVIALRKQGPAGLAALREFFKTGQDVKMRSGWGMANNRITSAPSLRIALLDALADWPGSMDASVEILRGTSRAFEAAIAIRNLEKAAPGAYRAEAIRALGELSSRVERGEYAAEGMNYIFDAMRHFDAPELLPAAEKLVAAQPWAAFQLLEALKRMPPGVRDPAYARLFAQPKVIDQLVQNPHALRSLDYSDPSVASSAAQIYAGSMNAKQRDRFLAEFGSNRAFAYTSDFFSTDTGTRTLALSAAANDTAELQGRLAFLDQIAPHSTTPVLQQRLTEAREDIQRAIEKPPVQMKGGTIRIGGGGAKIDGSVIQSFEIREK